MDDNHNFVRIEITPDLHRKIWLEGLLILEQENMARWKWVCTIHHQITHHLIARAFKAVDGGWSDETVKFEIPIPEVGGELLFFSDKVVGYDKTTSSLRKAIRADKMYRSIPRKLQLIEIDRRSEDRRQDADRVHATILGIRNGRTEIVSDHESALFHKYSTGDVSRFDIVVECYYNNTARRTSARGISVFYNRIQDVARYAELLRREIAKYIPGHGVL